MIKQNYKYYLRYLLIVPALYLGSTLGFWAYQKTHQTEILQAATAIAEQNGLNVQDIQLAYNPLTFKTAVEMDVRLQDPEKTIERIQENLALTEKSYSHEALSDLLSDLLDSDHIQVQVTRNTINFQIEDYGNLSELSIDFDNDLFLDKNQPLVINGFSGWVKSEDVSADFSVDGFNQNEFDQWVNDYEHDGAKSHTIARQIDFHINFSEIVDLNGIEEGNATMDYQINNLTTKGLSYSADLIKVNGSLNVGIIKNQYTKHKIYSILSEQYDLNFDQLDGLGESLLPIDASFSIEITNPSFNLGFERFGTGPFNFEEMNGSFKIALGDEDLVSNTDFKVTEEYSLCGLPPFCDNEICPAVCGAPTTIYNVNVSGHGKLSERLADAMNQSGLALFTVHAGEDYFSLTIDGIQFSGDTFSIDELTFGEMLGEDRGGMILGTHMTHLYLDDDHLAMESLEFGMYSNSNGFMIDPYLWSPYAYALDMDINFQDIESGQLEVGVIIDGLIEDLTINNEGIDYAGKIDVSIDVEDHEPVNVKFKKDLENEWSIDDQEVLSV